MSFLVIFGRCRFEEEEECTVDFFFLYIYKFGIITSFFLNSFVESLGLNDRMKFNILIDFGFFLIYQGRKDQRDTRFQSCCNDVIYFIEDDSFRKINLSSMKRWPVAYSCILLI